MLKSSKAEYLNLCKKVNKGYISVEYFRKNLFNASLIASKDLERKKTVYDDEKYLIKVDRSLNIRHRDLLSLLMFEENTKPEKDGSYKIKTNIYQLAKKMGYKNPKNSTNLIYKQLYDMQKTMFFIEDKKHERVLNHMLLGESAYDKETHEYIIDIPAKTAKYFIYTVGVLLDEDTNTKIIRIKNNKSKIKALIFFLISNKKLKNGIGFDKICERLDITAPNRKSEFKKQIVENRDLLEEFQISYRENKFFLDQQIVEFERAVNIKDIEKAKFKEFVYDLLAEHDGEDICTYTLNNKKEVISLQNNKICVHENGSYFEITNSHVVNAILKSLYQGDVF